MQTAQMVLDYLNAVLWPLVVGGALLVFRKQIASKIGDLTEASTPLVQTKFSDRVAREIESRAERASVEAEADQPAAPAASGDGTGEGPAQLSWLTRAVAQVAQDPASRFETARTIAATNPNAAVMLAYRQLENVARASDEVHDMRANPNATSKSLVSVVGRLGFPPDFLQSARDVRGVADDVTHGRAEVTTAGAFDLIDACDHLANVLASRAMSRLRHPSRAHVVDEWRVSV